MNMGLHPAAGVADTAMESSGTDRILGFTASTVEPPFLWP